jgi:hypothetical protein
MKVLYLIVILACNALTLNSQKETNHFTSGEKLKFVIYYGIIDGGYVEAELNKVLFEGKEVYHSKMFAHSIGIADKLYKVRDEYQAWFDPFTVLPYKSIRDIHEGRYTKYNVVRYYHSDLKVVNIDQDTFEIPSDVRDMVSVFHYVRNKDFKNMRYNEIIKINTFFDNEIFPFDMRYQGTEKIKTRMGTYNCIKLVPYVEPGRIFTTEDDMTIWLSNDSNRVPIRVKFNLKVGSIKCDLIEYSGLMH